MANDKIDPVGLVMKTSEDEGAELETHRALQPLGENPSDDAVREYFVATLENMGADEAVIAAAHDALREIRAGDSATASGRAAGTHSNVGRSKS